MGFGGVGSGSGLGGGGGELIDGMGGGGMKGWWKDVENCEVSILEKEGYFLQKYRVESDVSVILKRVSVSGAYGYFSGKSEQCGRHHNTELIREATPQKRPSGPVIRRYSDFLWLLDVLSKRYVSVGKEFCSLSDRELTFPLETFSPAASSQISRLNALDQIKLSSNNVVKVSNDSSTLSSIIPSSEMTVLSPYS